ncbi:MAG: hypothetical protein ACKPFD_05530 [Dolichospermum sp.]
MDFIGSITGLFGNKGNSYYMELKEETQEANVTQVATPVASVTPAPTAVAPATPAPTAVAPKAEPVKISVPTETNFATKYLIPKNTPRRRPGVNMSGFLDMARQVKTPV